MSVVLLKPNSKKKQYGRVVHLSAIEPPVWLALYAKQFPGAVLIDMEAEDIDHQDLISRLRTSPAEKVVIFATGSHPSGHIQQTQAAEELRDHLSESGILNGALIEIHSHLSFDPNKMGAVDWGRLPVGRYRAHNWHAWGRKDHSYGATFSSISCPFKCEFCCVRDFYGSDYAQRDPQLVVDDIRALVDKGVTNFKMMDELFAINNKVVHEVLDRLAASGLGKVINIWAYARIDTVNEELLRKLKRAGVLWLAYGIESGNPDIRRGVMKGNFTNQKIADVIRMTKDAGISIVGNYMFGFWDDTLATMQETFAFAQELNCEYSNFYCVTVYPGSALYDEMKARGVDLARSGEEFAQMSLKFKPVPTQYLTAGQVLAFRDQAFAAYYAAPSYRAMMQGKFGAEVVKEIEDMLSVNLRDNV